MAVAVYQPRERKPEADPLDTIVKGLQIASSIYGIKEGSQKADILKQQNEREALKAKNEEEGNLTAKETIGSFASTQYSDKPIPGGVAVKVPDSENPGAYVTKYAAAKPPVESDLSKLTKTLQINKMQDESVARREKSQFEKTPEGKISKLTGDKVKRFDEAKMGLNAINGMAESLDAGENTVSLIGSNNFTRNADLFDEAVGRMQSGGAIGVEEAKTFKNLRPKITDSPEQQRAKLLSLQKEFSSRLNTLGFKPEDVGLSVTKFKYGEKQGTESPPTTSAPQTVIQNGKTFILNPQTGKYEKQR